ncbi:hypothetical protein BGZ74_003548 [Mortierella antarctica]|nr:hypothetical protein BGZ74_003548 [Mortierella antarctica]
MNKTLTQSAPSTPSKSNKIHKILFEKTSEEESLVVQSQSEAFLPKFHDLAALGIQILIDTAADGNDNPDNDALLALDMNAVWTTLSETIVSSARRHLPSDSMGYGTAPTMSIEKARLRAKNNDFGNTVRTVRGTFVLHSSGIADRSVDYDSILAFISKYSASYSRRRFLF